jgi:hypothetical protein
LCGGIGIDGRKRLTGWLFKELICLWLLMDRSIFGRRSLWYEENKFIRNVKEQQQF